MGGDLIVNKRVDIERISIHASRMGGDRSRWPAGRRTRHFNPRLPDGRRLLGVASIYAISLFQSTPPGWEATRQHVLGFAVLISIHASRMGGDQNQTTSRTCHGNFNPRLPDGRRLHECQPMRGRSQGFQSTPPGWEATSAYQHTRHIPDISIHASRMGGDHILHSREMITGYFNPRLPDGRRQVFFLEDVKRVLISIHASRMGGDRHRETATTMTKYFNPRLPDGRRP